MLLSRMADTKFGVPGSDQNLIRDGKITPNGEIPRAGKRVGERQRGPGHRHALTKKCSSTRGSKGKGRCLRTRAANASPKGEQTRHLLLHHVPRCGPTPGLPLLRPASRGFPRCSRVFTGSGQDLGHTDLTGISVHLS